MDGIRECGGGVNRSLGNDRHRYRLSRKAGVITQICGNSPGDLEKCSHISPFKCILCEIISRLPLKALIEAIGYRKELGFSYKLGYGTFENRLRKQPILFYDL